MPEETAWQEVTESLPPEFVIVETKIHDQHGERNVQKLKRQGRLWWTPDGEMYVYYVPTHWRETSE